MWPLGPFGCSLLLSLLAQVSADRHNVVAKATPGAAYAAVAHAAVTGVSGKAREVAAKVSQKPPLASNSSSSVLARASAAAAAPVPVAIEESARWRKPSPVLHLPVAAERPHGAEPAAKPAAISTAAATANSSATAVPVTPRSVPAVPSAHSGRSALLGHAGSRTLLRGDDGMSHGGSGSSSGSMSDIVGSSSRGGARAYHDPPAAGALAFSLDDREDNLHKEEDKTVGKADSAKKVDAASKDPIQNGPNWQAENNGASGSGGGQNAESDDPTWDAMGNRGVVFGLPKIFWALIADAIAMACFVACIPFILTVAKRRWPVMSSGN